MYRIPGADANDDQTCRHAEPERSVERRRNRAVGGVPRLDANLLTSRSKRLATVEAPRDRLEEEYTIVLRAARFALLALTAFLMIGAASASARPRMPIGFFDDPTFRWSAVRMDNLQRASADGASIIHTTATWAALAPTRPADASNGDDPAYKLA